MSIKTYVTLLSFLAVFILAPFAALANCGGSVACEIVGENGGSYYFSLPDRDAAPSPLKLFVFFHGHNGSGNGVVRNRGLLRQLHAEGYTVVAPDGPLFQFNGRSARGWAARREGNNPRGKRNDIVFIENVLEDLASKFDIDAQQTVVSGFSSGGSMAWYFACHSKTPLAGVIAVAGGLRRPLPEGGVPQDDGSLLKTCSGGPRKLIHLHGFSDRQVPLEGRGIRSWHQGDVYEGLSVLRNTNQCSSRPNRIEAEGNFWCRDWTGCASEKPIRFCLHPGGHGMPKGWLQEGLSWIN